LLLSREGHQVTVIDRSKDAFLRLGKSPDILRFVGNGLDEDTLNKGRLSDADAFVACTAGDNTNIMAAQIARESFNIQKAGAKINDPIRAQEYRKMGIFTISEGLILASVFRDWIDERDMPSVEEYITMSPLAG